MSSCCDERVDATVGFVDAGDFLVEVEGGTGRRGGGGEHGDACVVTVGLVSADGLWMWEGGGLVNRTMMFQLQGPSACGRCSWAERLLGAVAS